jgi:hypothetical protein
VPFQNRVDPFGEFRALPARGLLMGNRGGRLHDRDRKLSRRRWTSARWICCRLEFKGRRRRVWGHGYTELFFLDEPTAFAAGHRPCFECRRRDAQAFAACWAKARGLRSPPIADDMDAVLHRQRLQGRAQRRHQLRLDDVPDGAIVVLPERADVAVAVRGSMLLHWTADGYAEAQPRPAGVTAHVLTPPAILDVLAAGYSPLWHPTAEAQ